MLSDVDRSARLDRSGKLSLALLGLILALVAPGCADRPPALGPAAARNLLFVSLDTVRRDHLSTYGYPRPTTPTLDRLSAGSGTLFLDAVAQEVNTNPSHTSMFTGLYPHSHGSVHNGWRLRDDQVPIGEILQDLGFATGGFVSGVPMAARASGLDRGFDVYDDRFDGSRRDGGITVDRALEWLAALREDRPYFAFVHLYDAHGPYLPPAGYESRFVSADAGGRLDRIPRYQRIDGAPLPRSLHANWYRDRYDALLRYLDDQVARLLEAVDLSETIVVIVSDHGETFDERYWQLDHGGQVFDEQVRIPLLIHVPGSPAARVETPVETTDLAPTCLELLGAPPEVLPEFQGRSLADLLRGGAGDAERPAFSSAEALDARRADRGYRLDNERRIESIRADGFKLIRYPGLEQDYFELYDLAADPSESVDVAALHPEVLAGLREQLTVWRHDRALVPAPPDEALPDELREKLRSLGYVD
jgi:arylsulfatase A-like enzyme